MPTQKTTQMSTSARTLLLSAFFLAIGWLLGFATSRGTDQITKANVELAKEICTSPGGYSSVGYSVFGDLDVSCVNGDTATCNGGNCTVITYVQFSSDEPKS